jgi:hypothetical protein
VLQVPVQVRGYSAALFQAAMRGVFVQREMSKSPKIGLERSVTANALQQPPARSGAGSGLGTKAMATPGL